LGGAETVPSRFHTVTPKPVALSSKANTLVYVIIYSSLTFFGAGVSGTSN